jgi:hypothetical protein
MASFTWRFHVVHPQSTTSAAQWFQFAGTQFAGREDTRIRTAAGYLYARPSTLRLCLPGYDKSNFQLQTRPQRDRSVRLSGCVDMR